MKHLILMLPFLYHTGTSAQDTLSSSQDSATALSFSGYVEAYIGYDFNRPEHYERPSFLYNYNRHNEFTLNLAFIKAVYAAGRARASLALAAGTYMNANYAAETGVWKNVYEGSAGYKLSRNRDLWFDIGILPSHIGFESAQGIDCPTLTRSLAAENSPYYEAGARLSYNTPDGRWQFAALALNGWQRIQRVAGNSGVSWGTQARFTPGGAWTLNYSTFFGRDTPDSIRRRRHFHDVYGILEVAKGLQLILGLDIGSEQQKRGSRDKNIWFTPAAILSLFPAGRWGAALRVEYFSDKKEVIVRTGTPNGFQTAGFSANIDYRPRKNMALRLEGRTFRSKDPVFLREGMQEKAGTALTFSTAVSF